MTRSPEMASGFFLRHDDQVATLATADRIIFFSRRMPLIDRGDKRGQPE